MNKKMKHKISTWRWRIQKIIKEDGKHMRMNEFAVEIGWSPSKLSEHINGRVMNKEDFDLVENTLRNKGV